ncbi:PQQ-dependent sugar dehydrogenase [Mycolicibacterium fluoranthenivorans]|uniref:Glucose/arabinose dehydrogenase n=1 Tax=Mycolicibacterium fluoranthenivorans TaxID=258505 RepID=A0A7X5R521_9MYCO|nr:gluconolaconase [Mycolicibacterium fluoranthenivorans]MCV7359419.1 gluconolaconase [Mycolicibacterium fluoranthenivorans]NIH93492.1 glucose/arabinose dehydrogenase [Mycolicibacterium fluoranthenivorans]
MRVWPRNRHLLCSAAVVLLAGCAAGSTPPPPAATTAPAAAPAGLVPVTVAVPDGLDHRPFDTARQALVPPGWTVSVWARVPKARLAAWAPDGRLLVSLPSTGQVVSVGPGRVTPLLSGLTQPHGLSFTGSTLLVAESDRITTYDYRDGSATGPRPIAAGLPDARSPELRGAYSHALKSVTAGSDGAVYFSIGSTGNISAQDRTADPPRATVMRVPPGGGPATVFATGVRNGTGLATAPDGSIWTAVNNRDNIADPATGVVHPDYVAENPPEAIARLTPGRELGWPFCHPTGGPADAPFIRDVQTNADGGALDCASLPPVEQTIGAHSAPLGMSFTEGVLPAPYDSGALLGVHGSWNRQPPRAPEVSFLPWRNGILGPAETLLGGFQSADGSRWGRPVSAVVGPDGGVYVTDDLADAVYRLAPPGLR